MYAITANVENWQGKRFTLVSKKKWASYDDARKNLENYIVTGYYVSEEEDED